jgi:hypothetical protein
MKEVFVRGAALALGLAALGATGCGGGDQLTLVRDVPLPGAANRFDYQDLDAKRGHLVIAHMDDDSVVIVDVADDKVLKVVPNVPVARGVVVADEVDRIFVTSSPDQLVMIDAATLEEVGRVTTGSGPDGVGWDAMHRVVGISAQGDGAVSLLADAGLGARRDVPLGTETGNVVFDASRGTFWVTVVRGSGPDRLEAIDPLTGDVVSAIDLPGCEGAHGLRLHPDGRSAFVACEDNAQLTRVPLDGGGDVVTASTGDGPDVLSIDPGRGCLYVAAESGDLVVFDIDKAGLVDKGHQHPGDTAHTVLADPSTHLVYFPLEEGPVLRIMAPAKD